MIYSEAYVDVVGVYGKGVDSLIYRLNELKEKK